MDKKNDFIGKKSLVKLNNKLKKQFAMFTLHESTPGHPLLLHDEPIYYEGKIVGETTSGNFSFKYDKNMSFGYIDSNIDIKIAKNNFFEIEVEKIKYKATLKTKALHDPNNFFIKS